MLIFTTLIHQTRELLVVLKYSNNLAENSIIIEIIWSEIIGFFNYYYLLIIYYSSILTHYHQIRNQILSCYSRSNLNSYSLYFNFITIIQTFAILNSYLIIMIITIILLRIFFNFLANFSNFSKTVPNFANIRALLPHQGILHHFKVGLLKTKHVRIYFALFFSFHPPAFLKTFYVF